MSLDEICAVCGRTILAGERTRGYLDGHEHRAVCELCVGRAERLGWRREEEGVGAAPPPPRRRGLGGFWRRREKRGDELEHGFGPEPESELGLGGDAELEFEGEVEEGEERALEERPAAPEAEAAEAASGSAGRDEAEPLAERPRPRRSPDPAAPGARPERLEPEPSALGPFERATERFNVSEAGRTVAGLSRTLGTPWVSVGASAGAPREVRITVAWELSWYQWGVDLGDESRPVFQIDKGLEMDQLDSAARQWNATAVEGRVILAPAARREAGDGEPARR